MSLSLDAELTDLEGAALSRHLERCPPCRVRFVELTAVTELLRQAPLVTRREPVAIPLQRVRRPRRTRRPLAAAGAVGATVVSLAAILSVAGSAPVFGASTSPFGFRTEHEQIRFAELKTDDPVSTQELASPSIAAPNVPSFSRQVVR